MNILSLIRTAQKKKIEISELDYNKEILLNDLANLEEERKAYVDILSKNRREIKETELQVIENKKEVKASKLQIKENKIEIEYLEEKLRAQNVASDRYRDNYENFLNKIEIKKQKIKSLNKEYDILNDKKEFLGKELDSLNDKKELLGKELDSLKEEIELLKDDKVQLVNELAFYKLNFEKLDSIKKSTLKKKKISNNIIFFRQMDEYNALVDLKEILKSFINKYFSESHILLHDEYFTNLVKYSNETDKYKVELLNLSLRYSNEIIENYHDNLVTKVLTIIKKHGFMFTNQYEKFYTYLRYELIEQIYYKEINKINYGILNTDTAETLFFSFFDYYDNLKSYNNLAFLAYTIYKENISIDFSSLEALYNVQMDYYENYEISNLEQDLFYQKTVKVKPYFSIKDVDKMSGIEFEHFLRDLFKKEGYKVVMTPYTNDQGADLIISKNKRDTIVQVKRYSSTVGNKAIQEAIAARAYYKSNSALVITNNFYTKQAVELAEETNIEIWDRNILEKRINKMTSTIAENNL